MPTVNFYDGFTTAGEEISSTYEGRHITLEESILIHPTHTDGFVNKGDPVYCDGIVGVALLDGDAATDMISIDTEGIWTLSVLGAVASGQTLGLAEALAIGDRVYINKTTGVLSGKCEPYFNAPFGYVLNEVTASTTVATVVAVKVHWTPNMLDEINVGADQSAPALLDPTSANRSTVWIRGYFHPSSLIENGEQIQGISIRMEDDLASTGGEITAAEFKVVKHDPTNVSVSALTGVKIGVTNTDGGAATEVKALAIAMGGVPGAAAAMQTAIQIVGDGTMGTLQSWFDTEIARGAGLKAQAQSLDQNTTHKIPISIDDVIYGIPVVPFA